MILFTPGPCMTSEAVRQAGAREDLNHRDPRFGELMDDVRQGLRELSGGMHPTVLGGSGTAAMEAMVSTLITAHRHVLVLSDGYYSARMVELLQIHGVNFKELSFPWLTGWSMDMIAGELGQGDFDAIVCTHHETTTGRLNDLGELKKIAGDRAIYVDAMSSLGADDLPFAGLAGVAASANKCLHGLPGVSFVLTPGPVAKPAKAATYYLDLSRYQGDSPPLTPPVPTLASFRQALREFSEAGGQGARKKLYEARANEAQSAFVGLGLTLPIPANQRSCTLTMASIPAGFTWKTWSDWNWKRGVAVYGCKGELSEAYWQMGHMGEFSGEVLTQYLSMLRWEL